MNGSVALVTGGGRGLGRVLARALADAGAAVGLVARSGDQLAESVDLIRTIGGSAAAAVADVGDYDAISAAIERLEHELGPTDLLVNNAGITGPDGPAWEVTPESWWRTVEVNLRGALHSCRAVLPGMVARGRGRIVNVTSEAGVFRWPLASAYSVSKAAVVKFTENLAYETRRFGISVFSFNPGLLPIGFSEGTIDAPDGSPGAWVRQQLADGHGVDPQEAARFVVRLASGEADALSGCHLSVHVDLDALIAHSDDIRRDDLHMLRVRGFTR
jgi:NAD(P)-dependent dehydrogenase (short-subunit alcohol dehydrogenase family)